MYDVAVVRYEKPLESLDKAVARVRGLENVSPSSKVFLKPNLGVWHEEVNFPKFGVLTTARLIEDIVVLLKENGANDITIAEGVIEIEKSTESTLARAARGMGLDMLAKRYGIKIVDALRGEFSKVTVGDVILSINKDILGADFIINMPVLKTHAQAMVSLGIKNLKGVLSIPSRKKCHTLDGSCNLDYRLAKLLDVLSPSLTIIDGIYSLEKGPLYTGKAYRSNVIVVSKDVVSADIVGATMLGINPSTVPYIVQAAGSKGRPTDLSDINVIGNDDIKTALQPHEWEFKQNESGDLPQFLERAGIKGMTYLQADKTMCTYCAAFIYYVIWGILLAKNRDKPFDDIEVLHGRVLDPSGGHKHTLLVGQCQVKRNSKNPLINHCVKIRDCPPSKKDLVEAYQQLRIDLPDNFLELMEKMPETFYRRYSGRPEFDESFYRIGRAQSSIHAYDASI